jgi:hypothetical protein
VPGSGCNNCDLQLGGIEDCNGVGQFRRLQQFVECDLFLDRVCVVLRFYLSRLRRPLNKERAPLGMSAGGHHCDMCRLSRHWELEFEVGYMRRDAMRSLALSSLSGSYNLAGVERTL